MKSNMISKARLAATALATAGALFAGASQAAIGDTYTDTFGGLTFTIVQTDADSLTLNISGTPSNDDNAGWAGVQFFGAFDLKNLGLDFTSDTGTANGPGATDLAGLNSQLSAANIDCSAATGQAGTICFDLDPDYALGGTPIDLTYTIDFSSALDIGAEGPHLQLVFTNTEGGAKVGSLYSQNLGITVPEPGSLALLGLGLGIVGFVGNRRRKS